MTNEDFIEQMQRWVGYFNEKLEMADLSSARLSKDIVGKQPFKYNPFIEFDEKYFNIKLLSNLQGLDMLIYENPNISMYKIKMFIVSNSEFKVLNQVLKYNPYMVEELKEKIHSPMDIAIAYARWQQFNDGYRTLQKR